MQRRKPTTYLPTWTEHIFVAVLCHFLQTHTIFTTMGRRWVGAWARTCLSSSTTWHTTFVPASPDCPASVHWIKLLYRAMSQSRWSKISSNGNLRCFVFHFVCKAWVSLWIRRLECLHLAPRRSSCQASPIDEVLYVPSIFCDWLQSQALHSS